MKGLRTWFLSLVVAIIALGGLSLSASPAHATAELVLTDLSTFVVDITDNGVGDLDPTVGVITFAGALGSGIVVDVTVGQSKPVIGGSSFSEVDLSDVTTFGAGGGQLLIAFTDTDFSVPSGGATAVNTVGGTVDPGGFAEFANFLDNGNVPFGGNTQLSFFGPFGPGSFSGSSSTGVTTTPPFSLSVEAFIASSGAGTISFDSNLRLVPEPASLMLLGSGLAGLAFLRRKWFV